MLNPYRMFKKLKVNLNMEFWSSKIKPDEQNSDYCNFEIMKNFHQIVITFIPFSKRRREKKEGSNAGRRKTFVQFVESHNNGLDSDRVSKLA